MIRSTIFFLFLLFSFHAFAAEQELQTLLKDVESYSGNFIQKTFDQEGVEIQSLQGQLKIRKPNLFYWMSEQPNQQTIVCNGEVIWHYDDDLEQVVIQKYSDQARKLPLMMVFQNPQRLTEDFVISAGLAEEGVHLFNLTPKDTGSPIASIKLKFIQGVLTEITFTDNLQQKTHLVLSGVSLNDAFSDDQFTFEVPDYADVIYE